MMTDVAGDAKLVTLDWSAKAQGPAFPDVEKGAKDAALLKVAGERRSEVAAFLKRAADEAAGLDADYVHDLRVAVRRLSQAAEVLFSLMDKGSARAVAESLKGLRRAAGDLRDLDVTVEHLTKWRMPGPVKKVARVVVEELSAKRGELEKGLRAAASAASLEGAMILLARVLEEQEKPECIAAAGVKLRRALEKEVSGREKKLRRSFGKAARKQVAAALHEARIAAKKLRYVVELEKELDEKGTKKTLAFLKGVQKLLGAHHDVHVIEEVLEGHLPRHLKTVKGLRVAWRKWKRETEKAQAKRAGEFFMRSYGWMNAAAK